MSYSFSPSLETDQVQPYLDTDKGRATPRKFVSMSGRRTADLDGIARDLTFVEKFATVLVDELSKPIDSRDQDMVAAYQDAALIRYRRCFAEGVRSRLTKKDVEAIAPNHIQTHEHFFELANKNVAHSVNNTRLSP